jgi:hypothetical protein
MIGTLTLSILKSVHTSMSLIIFYKLCSMATPAHLKPLLLENHVCIVALTPDLQRVSFYSVTEFLYHSSTTELILSLIFIKGSYPSSKALLLYSKSSLALWLLWRVNSGKVATWISTSSRSDYSNDIWVRAKRPCTSYNIYEGERF